MGGSFYPDEYHGPNYSAEKLREAAGLDSENQPTPNYECQTCGNEQYIDDHLRTAPNYCESCEGVRTFERLNRE